MKKSSQSGFDPSEFGDFTRQRIVTVLGKDSDHKSSTKAIMAASLLSSFDPRGPNPGLDVIVTAMDALAGAPKQLARGLLWQAAEHAANARLRVEALKRFGPFVQPDHVDAIRRWASEGFAPTQSYQNDQVSNDCTKAAALMALGNLARPGRAEIDIVVGALSQPSGKDKFSRTVFDAAVEAYWKIGDRDSLSGLVAKMQQRWQPDLGMALVGLSAKFSKSELKPHAMSINEALRKYAHQWQEPRNVMSRLIEVTKKTATPESFRGWASSYGGDGLENGRGKITRAMQEALDPKHDDAARANLALARWPINLRENSGVITGLAEGVRAGHHALVARTVIEHQHDGYRKLLEEGTLLDLYETMDVGVGAVCEALSACHAAHRQRAAQLLAKGVFNVAIRASRPDESPVDIESLTGKGAGRDSAPGEAFYDEIFEAVEALDPSKNPVALVAGLLCPPTSSQGALAIVETLSRWDSPAAEFVIRSVIRQAGRLGESGEDAPVLREWEQLFLTPEDRKLRATFEAALAEEVVFDGKVNRYALLVAQRENLSFSTTARKALDGLSSLNDAEYLLNQLHAGGADVGGVLQHGVTFHRDIDPSLTEFVRKTSIELRTRKLIAAGTQKQREDFARQLQERFHDSATVRIAAYRACGELGGLFNIKALRNRRERENSEPAKAAIDGAIASLKERLVAQKGEQATPEEFVCWLGYVGDLGDPALLPNVVGCLEPPHPEQCVRLAALAALSEMGGCEALDVVTRFMEDTAPEGETLSAARRARMRLEDRRDTELFEVLAVFYKPDNDVLDPAIDYGKLLGTTLLASSTKALQKAQRFWEEGHWDEFVTRLSGVVEAMVKQVVRKRYAEISWDQAKAEKMARGSLANILNSTEFKNGYSRLQAHANTLYSFRHGSPTAHVMNVDGSSKEEASEDDAEYVREEFLQAFEEAVKALR